MVEAGVGSSPSTDAASPSMTEGKEGEKAKEAMGEKARLGSDPLGPEEKKLAEGAGDKRPEEREEGDSTEGEGEGEGDEDEEFDYLAYAQQRALFFWGDVLQLGLVSLEELPKEVRGRVKLVEY